MLDHCPKCIWHNCYEDGWQGLIVEDAFAHPAKMARGLVRRIFDRLNLPRGSLVVDPFGGIGSTAIEAASRGLRCVCVELEPKFVELGRRNFAKHQRLWESCGDPLPVIVQGDSRRLRDVLGAAGVDCVVSSPPYAGNDKSDYLLSDDGKTRARDERRGYRQGSGCFRGSEAAYGDIPGNLGNLPSGSVDAVVGSPPFSTGDSASAQSMTRRSDKSAQWVKNNCGSACTEGYGQTPGQLGNLPSGKADAVVGSPPYEGSEGTPSLGGVNKDNWGTDGRGIAKRRGLSSNYGTTDGQLGHTTGDTFWHAAAAIVRECHAILKPGGLCVWVCKDFVRKGQRVPFSRDWLRLCESCGFRLREWVQASLVKEQRHAGLFGEDVVRRTERKSFFRRLAERKGSPAIDHEDVLLLRSCC